MCSPITLPFYLFLHVMWGVGISLKAVGRGVGWTFTDSPPVEKLSEVRRARRIARSDAEWERESVARERANKLYEDYRLASLICCLSYGGVEQGPKPKKPPPTAKVADAVGTGADHVAAFMQRPKVDAAMSLMGKFFVRCVFYPLMILVPTAAFMLLLWTVVSHVNGVATGLHATFVTPANAIGGAAAVSWWYIVMVALGSAALSGLIAGAFWIVGKMDSIPERPPRPPSPVVQAAKVPFKVGGHAVKHGACATGRGLRTTGKFFVIGHHSVKYRTCPRIHITQDACR